MARPKGPKSKIPGWVFLLIGLIVVFVSFILPESKKMIPFIIIGIVFMFIGIIRSIFNKEPKRLDDTDALNTYQQKMIGPDGNPVKIQVKCYRCGVVVNPHYRYCHNCGTRLRPVQQYQRQNQIY